MEGFEAARVDLAIDSGSTLTMISGYSMDGVCLPDMRVCRHQPEMGAESVLTSCAIVPRH